jgi:hypothetical protein
MARNITNLNGYTTERELSVFHKGDTMPMKIDSAMASAGWSGGTFVRWVDDGTGEPCVTIADGRYCGFTPWGSDEPADQYTSMTPSQTRYKYITLFFGGNFVATTSYERYTYISRHGPGPLVPLVYAPQDFLYVSENGLPTVEDESDPAVNPGHTFPNGDPIVVPFLYFGIVSVPPSALTDDRLLMQTNVGV